MLDTTELLRLIEENYHKPYERRAWTPQELYVKAHPNFDCSSLVMWLYFQLGYKLPRVSQDQYTFCDKINYKEAKVGTNLVLLEPDVAKAFPDASAVNEALRLLAEVAKRKPRRARPSPKKRA